MRSSNMNSLENPTGILAAILDVGETMLVSGAEVNRVENTIRHMGSAYGFSRVDVFTITSSIIVTAHIFHTQQEEILTQTRRISEYETDMWKIEKCNTLSRSVSAQPLPLEKLREEIAEIRKGNNYPEIVIFFTYGMISFVFSIFFGGSIGDAAAAFLAGLFLWLIVKIGKKLQVQHIILTLLCSGMIGIWAVIFKNIGLAHSVDKVIIGNIMLLIPGLSLTTALRDMISGDIISGLLGLCEAILKAVAIAAGIALVLWRVG